MWRILQQDEPDDFVLATGVTHTVRSFCDMAFNYLDIKLRWEGEGANERGINLATGKSIIEIDPRYFRPTEVELLIGDATKAKEKLGWIPTYTLDEMVAEMVESDRIELERELQGGSINGF
jgi:GDPmannose 4,6-dehydratase